MGDEKHLWFLPFKAVAALRAHIVIFYGRLYLRLVLSVVVYWGGFRGKDSEFWFKWRYHRWHGMILYGIKRKL